MRSLRIHPPDLFFSLIMTLEDIRSEISGVYAEIEDLLCRFSEEYLEASLEEIDFTRMFADMDRMKISVSRHLEILDQLEDERDLAERMESGSDPRDPDLMVDDPTLFSSDW